jgi:hypothetical protein
LILRSTGISLSELKNEIGRAWEVMQAKNACLFARPPLRKSIVSVTLIPMEV